ncbi:MAG: hypothetical protein P1P81_06350 [Desulfobulbales bacterium]|nr:hypothetical protein [Desulfobulbales bacterium]
MKRKEMFVPMLQAVCCLAVIFPLVTAPPVSGAEVETIRETKIDQRDVYLNMEGLCGAEGLPYEYMTPADKYLKTRIDPRDIYLDMEAMCGAEGLPYRYLIIPKEYVRIKHDPQDLELDLEKMLTDDPSFVKGQEEY